MADDYRLNPARMMPVTWINSFMHLVNKTWPHREHVLINCGIAATDLKFLTGVSESAGRALPCSAACWCLAHVRCSRVAPQMAHLLMGSSWGAPPPGTTHDVPAQRRPNAHGASPAHTCPLHVLAPYTCFARPQALWSHA